MNIDEGVSSIADSLFTPVEGENETEVVDTDTSVDATPAEPEKQADKTQEQQVTQAAPATRAVPKSWAREYHEHWPKLDPKVQEYIELREKQMLDGLGQYKEFSELGKQFKGVIDPYSQYLQTQKVDPVQAVNYLLSAHYKLTNGTPEQRAALIKQIERDYGISSTAENPELKAMKDTIARLEGELTTFKQYSENEVKSKVSKEVDAFAKDHPYFDEVAEEMALYIKAGDDLNKAYEKAVWANPVTRQKEQTRIQTESEKALKEKAEKEAAAAKKAAGPNMRTRDTNRTPTEKVGKLFGPEHEEEMRQIVQGRAH